MASFTDTFERKEVKYRLNAKQHREVLNALAGRMAADEYGRTRITSLYFDTPTRDLIARSLEKPLYKEKLRLRWYGTPTSGERVYVEIKKKYDGIVYKRRVGCSLTAAYAYLMGRVPYENACVQNPLSDQLQQDEALTLHSIQIAREIDAFAARYRNLRPSMYHRVRAHGVRPGPGRRRRWAAHHVRLGRRISRCAGRRARGGQHLPSAFGPGRDDHGGEDRRRLPVLAGRGAWRMPGVSVIVQPVRRRLPRVRTCRRCPFRSRCLPVPDLPKG